MSQFIPASRYNAPKIFSRRIGGKAFVTHSFKDDAPALSEEIKALSNDIKDLVPNIQGAKKLAEQAEKDAKDVSTKQAEMLKELQELNESEKKNAEWRKEWEANNTKNQDATNQIITELKTMRESGLPLLTKGDGLDFGSSLAKSVKENFGSIKGVTKGKATSFELASGTGMYNKAASNMTSTGNLTGNPVITYVPTPFLLPRQLVNFRDLVPSFQSETGLISIFREDGGPSTSPQQGAIAQQLTQGALKEQIGYTFTNVSFTADYIAGFVRISKQMLQDLPFLQTYLPQMLMRDYYKRENAIFFAAQAAAALGSTTTTGDNDAEKMIDYIANLETTNFAPNGIVTTPLVWAKLMKTIVPTTGSAYSVPGGFYINPRTGDVEIAGIPVLKATWMTANTALIADWTQSQVAVVDGLKVEFFEQDSDNVQRNLITVRVECRCVLVTGQPYAFVYATGL